MRREPRVSTLDFSQPTKFTADFRRRIHRVLTPFCEAAAGRLSAELRTTVEIDVREASQLTWSAARAQLPTQTVAVALLLKPIERQMLLEIELPLVLAALECLLGSTPDRAANERRLSEIDWALTRGLLEAIVGALAVSWRDLGELELTYGQVDMEGDAGVFAPIGEPTFLVTLRCCIDSHESTISLLIPWSAIEPIAGEIAGDEGRATQARPQERHAIERGVAGAQVTVRAEVGSRTMAVEEMLALAPGTLLTLSERAEEGVALFAEGTPLGHGKPGLRGARRAVKVSSQAPPRQRTPPPAPAEGLSGRERMLGVPVRVCAELGRTRMALGETLGLPPGTVVELEQSADAPVELFAGGHLFAHGSLQVSAGGEWAVQVQKLI